MATRRKAKNLPAVTDMIAQVEENVSSAESGINGSVEDVGKSPTRSKGDRVESAGAASFAETDTSVEERIQPVADTVDGSVTLIPTDTEPPDIGSTQEIILVPMNSSDISHSENMPVGVAHVVHLSEVHIGEEIIEPIETVIASPVSGTTIVGTSSADNVPTAVPHVPAAVQTVVLSASGSQQTGSTSPIPSPGKVQPSLTTSWLLEHFEVAESMSLPRNALYSFYIDFCEQNNLHSVNAASFGKIIRQVFPVIKTRRLGTRGQSKYHYYGIGVKAASPYHSAMVTAARRQTVSGPRPAKHENSDATARNKFVLASAGQGSHSGQASAPPQPNLNGFPNVCRLKLPEEVDMDKAEMFVVMYKAHCQRILDSILSNNFTEVENFIVHFWLGMPEHMHSLLECKVIAQLVGVCDYILYRAIMVAIIPSTVEQLSLTVTHSIRHFAKQLTSWIAQGLANLPECLRNMKEEVANAFVAALRRRTSVSHLAQATRSVLLSRDSVEQMLTDWQQLDLTSITYQSLYTFQENTEKYIDYYLEFMAEFEDLVSQQANVESFAQWLGTVVDRAVVQRWNGKNDDFADLARDFLLHWQFFTTRVVRDLTLHSAPSFGSYHLLNMLFEDYILFLLESKMYDHQEGALVSEVNKFLVDESQPAVASSSLSGGKAADGSGALAQNSVIVLPASVAGLVEDKGSDGKGGQSVVLPPSVITQLLKGGMSSVGPSSTIAHQAIAVANSPGAQGTSLTTLAQSGLRMPVCGTTPGGVPVVRLSVPLSMVSSLPNIVRSAVDPASTANASPVTSASNSALKDCPVTASTVFADGSAVDVEKDSTAEAHSPVLETLPLDAGLTSMLNSLGASCASQTETREENTEEPMEIGEVAEAANARLESS